jgi:hypothetical protein
MSDAHSRFSKPCYRCTAIVRMSREQYHADENECTTCDVCKAKLKAEVAVIGLPTEKGDTP